MNPVLEPGQGVQSVGSLVVVEKTAAVAPSAAFLFDFDWWLPFPRPVELHRWRPSSVEGANMADVFVVVLDIRVRMKFMRDQIFKILCICSVCKSETLDHIVNARWEGSRDSIDSGCLGGGWALFLSNDKSKAEVELVLVG